MPELPEVETVLRGLQPVMEGRRIMKVEARRPDLRFPFPENFAKRLSGRRVTALRRRAKYLVADLDGGETFIAHLGMSGRFTIMGRGEAARPGKFHHDVGGGGHDHVVFHMEGGARIIYSDPRRFGYMDLLPTAAAHESRHLSGLGPEPLGNGFNGAYLSEALSGKASPIKAALLDQRVVAGLGNIYVCEALFRAGVSPRRKANSTPGARAERIAAAVRAVLMEAIEAGGSSLRDYADVDGALGYFQHAFKVYGREGAPCPVCAAPVKRIVQSGRSTFYCGFCQR
ncbi:MAG: bifunctional DNA-formamidopyrimidine glycosylase/DNA-(apurinic or apyrimidinic site) lyase [Pseudomonadota bacterium]